MKKRSKKKIIVREVSYSPTKLAQFYNPQFDRNKKGEFDKIFGGFITSGKTQTQYNGFSLNELYNENALKRQENRSPIKVYQEIHNYYAKKLGVPPVLVNFISGESEVAHTICKNFKNSNDIIRIEVNKNFLKHHNLRTIFTIMSHESKHVAQAYVCYNYFKYNKLPKTDLEKLYILCRLFSFIPSSNYGQIPYRNNLTELDAYLFDYKMSREEILNNENLCCPNYLFMHFQKMKRLLNNFEYERNGLNSYIFHKVYRALKKDMHDSLSGKYGIKYKLCVEELLQSGFNLENGITSLTNDLDKVYDKAVSFGQIMEENGFSAPWLKNGNLMYKESAHLTNKKQQKKQKMLSETKEKLLKLELKKRKHFIEQDKFLENFHEFGRTLSKDQCLDLIK